jgi:predicted nuclease of predicted toxin-antitoxin system
MRLLVDANISHCLCKKISDLFENVLHLEDTRLPVPAADHDIWSWAKYHDYMLITNDDDFKDLVERNGFPPKIILLRVGNQSTSALIQIIRDHYSDISDLYNDDTCGILEIV